MKLYKAYLENSDGEKITWAIEASNEEEARELIELKLPSWIYYDTTTAFRIDEVDTSVLDEQFQEFKSSKSVALHNIIGEELRLFSLLLNEFINEPICVFNNTDIEEPEKTEMVNRADSLLQLIRTVGQENDIKTY